MHLTWVARSDPGRRRATNEDSYCARDDLGLFVVADGMGGHVAGEVASRIAVEEIERFVETTVAVGPQDTWPMPIDPAVGRDGNRLSAGLTLANRRIADRVEGSEELRGMATTVVAALVRGDQAALAHVGDSRAYLQRATELRRLTRDHSWVEEQMLAGMLSAAAARDHPWRNIVTRAMSGTDPMDVDVNAVELVAGDRLLLCSDGLTSVLDDGEVDSVLRGTAPLDARCEELVRRVNEAGGPDNVTVVVIDIDAG